MIQVNHVNICVNVCVVKSVQIWVCQSNTSGISPIIDLLAISIAISIAQIIFWSLWCQKCFRSHSLCLGKFEWAGADWQNLWSPWSWGKIARVAPLRDAAIATSCIAEPWVCSSLFCARIGFLKAVPKPSLKGTDFHFQLSLGIKHV